MKLVENIKFSNEMPYRLVSLLEKLQFLEKITKIRKISNFPVESYPVQ